MSRISQRGLAELDRAYDGTDGMYAHFDMDVMGGAGPAPGDILGAYVAQGPVTEKEGLEEVGGVEVDVGGGVRRARLRNVQSRHPTHRAR